MFKDLMILTELILKDDLIERKEKIFVNIERFHMTSGGHIGVPKQ